ncbi:MAG: hypothetical protein L3K23_08310 [Thermoplasmata archaeon]|nr:hypothetical protein [Thermoplasmata archaeon]
MDRFPVDAIRIGEIVTSPVTVLLVRPVSVSLTANVSSVPVNGSVRLTAAVSGGAEPLRVSWTGLPTGCSASGGGYLYMCVPSAAGTFHVTVWVNYSTGHGPPRRST